jgi:Ca2+-binding EF-hand superfamily protein
VSFTCLRFHCNYSYHLSATFAVFDTNHDGTVDFSEFVLASALENKNDLDSKLDLSFRM